MVLEMKKIVEKYGVKESKSIICVNEILSEIEKNRSRPMDAEVSDDMANIKQAFYVKAKIQSKETLGLVFNTDHLVHLGDLPISQIEHAIYDEIAKRIKEREDDKYEILAIEKIILALDNPPERT